MSFAIWKQKPPFVLADSDQEKIYQIGNVFVVTDDPARATQASVDAMLNAAPIDISDVDNLDKTLKAGVLLTRKYANDLKAGTYVAKTVADTKADFKAIFQALP